MSLNNLANRLSELGRREAALAAAEEAVGLYRELAAARPDAFRPDLAMSLNNLADSLSELGRREAALAAAEEAVGLYRELAAARPDAFRPEPRHVAQQPGQHAERSRSSRDGAGGGQGGGGIYRELAAARPDAFNVDLARSLSVLGTVWRPPGERSRRWHSIARRWSTIAEGFLASPVALASLMVSILPEDFAARRGVGELPDVELVRPLVEALKRLSPGKEEEIR